MLWLWILLVIAGLLTLLCMTRVGVWAAFDGETLHLDARAGLLRINILSAKPKKPGPEKEKNPEKPKKAKKEKPKKERPKQSIALEDVRDALHTMLPPLGRALGRMGRGIRFKPLRLSLTLGGQEDPAASARLCGELQAAVWGGMPQLERLVDIRDVHIHTDVDFMAPDTAAEGEIGVTFRIGTLLAVGFGLALPALGWFLRWRKRCKTRPPKPEKKGPPDEEIPPGKTEEPAA